MTQKVIKVGDSAAVTIPKKALEELNIKIGDRINIHIDKKRGLITIKPPVTVDEKLISWTNKFIEKYRPALEELAKK
mgnify:CR=1 FL=1